MFGLFTAAAATVCVAHRVLPRWLGLFGVVSGVLAVAAGTVGIVQMTAYNPLPFLAGTLWVLIASVLLALGREQRARVSDESAPAAIRTGVAAGA
jgi:hypothetical protein